MTLDQRIFDLYERDRKYIDLFEHIFLNCSKDSHYYIARLCYYLLDDFKYCPNEDVFYSYDNKECIWKKKSNIKTDVAEILLKKLRNEYRNFHWIRGTDIERLEIRKNTLDLKLNLGKTKKEKKEKNERIEFSELEEEILNLKKSIDSVTLNYWEVLGAIPTISYRNYLMTDLTNLLADENFSKSLNNNPDVLSVANGMIDLKTGILRKRTKEDLFTYCLDINYNDKSLSTEWEDFVNKIMCKDKDIIDFLQKLCGYGITGNVTEQIFVLLNGKGSNGKSVFSIILKDVLGSLYHSANKELITDCTGTKPSAHSAHLASLVNKRVVVIDDTKSDDKINDGLIKKMTGTDSYLYRPPHGKKELVARIEYLLFMCCNIKPAIMAEEAMVRRVLVIPFDAKFKLNPSNKNEYAVDKGIKDKLLKNKEGILNWIVKGSIKWYKDGLMNNIPDRIKKSTEEYIEENDVIETFLKNFSIKGENLFTSISDILYTFKLNFQESKIDRKTFIYLMTNKGYTYKKHKKEGVNKNKWGFEGFQLNLD